MTDDKKPSTLSRRHLIQILATSGVGATALSFQNCAQTGFSADGSLDNPLKPTGVIDPPIPEQCTRPWSIYDIAANPGRASENASRVETLLVKSPDSGHRLNAKLLKTTAFNHEINAMKDQYLLAVDVGDNPGLGMYHKVGTPYATDIDFITDIMVFRKDNNSLLRHKRFSASDQAPAALFLLEPALIAQNVQIEVVAFCLVHGFFGEELNLGGAAVDYSTAVPAFNAAASMGGSSLLRPYVAAHALGGQVMSAADQKLHSPHFYSVSNTDVACTLGAVNAKHGALATNHYVAAASLYDEHSNLIATLSEQTYFSAQNHNIIFDRFNLLSRRTQILRVVVHDTFNGYLMGFRAVA